jgi:AcrR family transcriptional regulator
MTDWKEIEKLSRKEKEYLFRRKEILEAAFRLFVVKGYSGVSMQEIAAESEFSIGTLYNFFANKEELFLTMVEEKFTESRQFIERKVAEKVDAFDKLCSAVEAELEFIESNRGFFTFFVVARGRGESEAQMDIHEKIGEVHMDIHEKIEEHFERHIEFLQGLIDACKREHYLKELDSRKLALTLIGIINAWIFNWLKGPEDIALREQKEHIMDLFLNGAGGTLKKKKKLG